MAQLPVLTPSMDFRQASAAVVDYLKEAIPLGYWSVSRYDGSDQVYLSVRDDAYGKIAGDRHAWSESLCQYATTGRGPQIAPDTMAVPLYAASEVVRRFPVGAYVGIPIHYANGELFGTLCGLDPVAAPAHLESQAGLLALLSTLLGTVLQADLERADNARRLERAELLSESDTLTGLLNRRGWERYIALEEERYRRFGDPGSVVVLDLDGLKARNDSDGHGAGDRYICDAASVLLRMARNSDMVARLGGDEFGVLAARTTPAETDILVTRIRAEMECSGVEASMGHAPYTFVAGFPGAWEAADAAMYEDKRRRRAFSPS